MHPGARPGTVAERGATRVCRCQPQARVPGVRERGVEVTDIPPTVEHAVRDAMAVLARNTEYLYIEGDREFTRSLTTKQEWTNDEKIRSLMLFHKYRRFLVWKGVEYYTVFPKTKQNQADIERIMDVSKALRILEKTYGIRPPFGFDMMPFDDLQEWTQMKVREVIESAKRNGRAAATTAR